MIRRSLTLIVLLLVCTVAAWAQSAEPSPVGLSTDIDYWDLLFVLILASFIGLGVIARVSRLLHTPLLSLTNAISAQGGGPDGLA